MTRLIVATLLLGALPGSALHGQHVVSSAGGRVVLSAGSNDGVRRGMSGKLCAPEIVGGRIVRNCSARFSIVSVLARQSTGRITKGSPSEIRAGMLAEFDEKLTPPKKGPTTRGAEEKVPARNPRAEATRAFREATRAFDEGDFRGALERFESYVRAFPEGENVIDAKRGAERSRERLAEMLAPAPAPQTPPPPPPRPAIVPAVSPLLLKADELVTAAERLFGEGKMGEARVAAIDALRADSTNARALAILSAVRTKAVQSRFSRPADVALGSNGILFVADAANNTVRRVAEGTATTLAGRAGEYGSADGRGGTARFNDPVGVSAGRDGEVFVVDRYNATVRRISPDGVVTTVAGRAGMTGATDAVGSSARFNGPRRIATTADGILYVSDTGNRTIRRISFTGEVTTLLDRNSGRIDPVGIAVDGDGSILFTDTWNHVIWRIDRAGQLSVVAGVPGSSGASDGAATGARFHSPEGVAVDAQGHIFIADTGNHTIRRIANGVVTTIAGRAGLAGTNDGTPATARFNRPVALVCDERGTIWIADSGNHVLRSLTGEFVETIAGLAGTAGSADGAN